MQPYKVTDIIVVKNDDFENHCYILAHPFQLVNELEHVCLNEWVLRSDVTTVIDTCNSNLRKCIVYHSCSKLTADKSIVDRYNGTCDMYCLVQSTGVVHNVNNPKFLINSRARWHE